MIVSMYEGQTGSTRALIVNAAQVLSLLCIAQTLRGSLRQQSLSDRWRVVPDLRPLLEQWQSLLLHLCQQ